MQSADRTLEKPGIWDRWQQAGDTVSLARKVRAPALISIDAQPERITIDLSTSALMIIDMQNDFLHDDGWFAQVRNANVAPLWAPIEPINALSDMFRRAQVPVIHLNWGVRLDAANLPANVVDKASSCGRQIGYSDPMTHGPVLVADSWGARSVDGIDMAATDYKVSKHRLSGFRDNELDQILRRLGITTIFYSGVNLDRCVFATLMDGCFQGYDAILVEDACATVSPEPMSQSILALVHMLYGFSAHSAAIIAAAQAQIPPSNSNQKQGER
ncbi:MAG: isochorismatase family cysteine hydrolase [Pseudomonadota bacterium]